MGFMPYIPNLFQKTNCSEKIPQNSKLLLLIYF